MLGLFLAEMPAVASSKQACLDAHAEAQKSRNARDFAAAKAQLLVCNQDSCPGPVAEDCARWMSELLREQPTVVFVARDAQGQDTPEVRVSLDEAVLLSRLDGHPVEVNPGPHRVRYDWADGVSQEVRVMINAGEKARRIELAPPGPAPVLAPLPPRADEAGIPTASWILWGGGAAAGGAFVVLAILGQNQEAELSRTCRGQCAPAEVSSLRTKYALADAAWITALAAAGAGTVLALWPVFRPSDAVELQVGPSSASARLTF
ncbi:MAG: hypothetical protein U1E65_21115 [Myxococcota bacterium]